MARKQVPPAKYENPVLKVSREQAQKDVNEQIEKGNNILETEIRSQEQLDELKAKRTAWRDFTGQLLKTIFSTNELSTEFSRSWPTTLEISPTTLESEINKFRSKFRLQLNQLVSIQERLQLFDIESSGYSQGAIDSNATIEQTQPLSSPVERQLRKILAELYPDIADIRRVAEDAGLNIGRIAFDTKAINSWHAILSEAKRTNKVGVLFDVVLEEYEANPKLCQAIDAYRAYR